MSCYLERRYGSAGFSWVLHSMREKFYKDIQPVKQTGSEYGLAVMVNDCDGYQWYMRCKCDKSKYDLLKAELLGKAANIYGTYAGYSGVTNRPMLDINSVFEVGGNAVSMELYK